MLEILNNCIPPTFIIGINVIAITIIPIPPSHCRIALQTKIDFGTVSRFTIIVEPVVVIPDILSKKASVIVKLSSEKIKATQLVLASLGNVKFSQLQFLGKVENAPNKYRFGILGNNADKIANRIILHAQTKEMEEKSIYVSHIKSKRPIGLLKQIRLE